MPAEPLAMPQEKGGWAVPLLNANAAPFPGASRRSGPGTLHLNRVASALSRLNLRVGDSIVTRSVSEAEAVIQGIPRLRFGLVFGSINPNF